jgi:predicted DNA-binding protein with PD1-like motif
MRWRLDASIANAASSVMVLKLEESSFAVRTALNMSMAMRTKLLNEADRARTFAVVLQAGDECMACLKQFANDQNIGAAQITAIGAFSSADLAFFDWETKEYIPIEVHEQVEVASLIGDIACGPSIKPEVHAHAVLSDRRGVARAGHLLKGHVRPTLEIIVAEAPAHMRKVHDPESGLALLALDKS